MVVIRLARVGSTKRPKYRVTVADSRRQANGRFIEVIGSYNPSPMGKDPGLVLDMPKVKEWIGKGAQPTKRVQSLIKKAEAN